MNKVAMPIGMMVTAKIEGEEDAQDWHIHGFVLHSDDGSIHDGKIRILEVTATSIWGASTGGRGTIHALDPAVIEKASGDAIECFFRDKPWAHNDPV